MVQRRSVSRLNHITSLHCTQEKLEILTRPQPPHQHVSDWRERGATSPYSASKVKNLNNRRQDRSVSISNTLDDG